MGGISKRTYINKYNMYIHMYVRITRTSLRGQFGNTGTALKQDVRHGAPLWFSSITHNYWRKLQASSTTEVGLSVGQLNSN